jgi:uncharacterized protein (TIGR02996 family)
VNLEDALLQEVCANPDEDGPRLVYADWCEENGRPERAEHIRAQVEAARLDEDDPRRDELEKKAAALEKRHAKEWLGPLRAALDRPGARQLQRGDFQRGFLHQLTLEPRRPDFLAAAAGPLGREPVEELALCGRYGRVLIPHELSNLSDRWCRCCCAICAASSTPITARRRGR